MIPVYPDETGFEQQHGYAAGAAAPLLSGAQPASFQRRVAAGFLDVVAESSFQAALGAVTAIVVAAVLSARGFEGAGAEGFLESAEEMTMWIYAVTVSIGNQLVLQGLTGATFGKHVLGLQVFEGDGARPLSFKTACKRYFARWISVCSLGLGFLFAIGTARRQTLHDLMAHTVVLKNIKESDHVGR